MQLDPFCLPPKYALDAESQRPRQICRVSCPENASFQYKQEYASITYPKKGKRLFSGPISPRRIGDVKTAHLLDSLMINIGMTVAYELLGPLIELIEVVAAVCDAIR